MQNLHEQCLLEFLGKTARRVYQGSELAQAFRKPEQGHFSGSYSQRPPDFSGMSQPVPPALEAPPTGNPHAGHQST